MGRAFKTFFQKIFSAMLLAVTLCVLAACAGTNSGGPLDGNPQGGGANQAAAPGLGGGNEPGSPTADWTDKILVLNCVGSTGSNIPDDNSDSDQDGQNNKVVYHVKGKIGLVFAGSFHPCIGSCKDQTVRVIDHKSNKFYEIKVDGNGEFSVDIVTDFKANIDFYRRDDNYSPTNPAEWQSCATPQCVEIPPWLDLPPGYKDTSCDFLQAGKKIFLNPSLP